MAGYTAFADLEVGSSVRGKINTQFNELFGQNAAASITVADAAALAAIPAEYLSVGKIAHQYDNSTDYEWTGAAWVVHVPEGGQFYGESYLYENASPMVIDITGKYHAITDGLEGLENGFTYKASRRVTVSGVASAAGGTKITCTSVGHQFLDGEVITINNSTNYDGVYLVESKTNDTFVVAAAFVATRTFPAVRGFSLRANAGTSGVFSLEWNAAAKNASSTNKDWVIEPNINLIAQDKGSGAGRLPSATETSTIAAGCLLNIAAGDYIWMSCKNNTDAIDIVIVNANLRIIRV